MFLFRRRAVPSKCSNIGHVLLGTRLGSEASYRDKGPAFGEFLKAAVLGGRHITNITK